MDGFVEIGTRITPYIELRDEGQPFEGKRIYLHFCAYGDNDDEAFDNLNVLFEGLFHVMKAINSKIP